MVFLLAPLLNGQFSGQKLKINVWYGHDDTLVGDPDYTDKTFPIIWTRDHAKGVLDKQVKADYLEQLRLQIGLPGVR